MPLLFCSNANGSMQTVQSSGVEFDFSYVQTVAIESGPDRDGNMSALRQECSSSQCPH